MNKNLLATILAIFLIFGIACVCATEVQSTSDHGGNDHNYYFFALFDGPDFDDGVIDVFDFDIFDFPLDDVFDFDLPDIPFFSD